MLMLTQHILERFGHHKRAGPVEGGCHRGSRATYLGWQNLAHHEPGNRTEAQREAQNVDNKATQWQPAHMGEIHALRLAVEEAAQHKERENHCHIGDIQQNLQRR